MKFKNDTIHHYVGYTMVRQKNNYELPVGDVR